MPNLEMREDMDRVVLVIENRQPVPALALSELLAALARDYRKQNRARTLVVSRVEDGSIWITLLDMAQAALPYAKGAAEAAKGGKAVVDFGKSLASLMKLKKNGQDASKKTQEKTPIRSIEKMVKLAVEANCGVRIRQVGADGSSLEVEISNSEALAIQQSAFHAKESEELFAVDRAATISADPKRIAELVDSIERLRVSDQWEDSDVLKIIISTIKRSSDDRLIEDLAIELEKRGFEDTAKIIRNS